MCVYVQRMRDIDDGDSSQWWILVMSSTRSLIHIFIKKKKLTKSKPCSNINQPVPAYAAGQSAGHAVEAADRKPHLTSQPISLSSARRSRMACQLLLLVKLT